MHKVQLDNDVEAFKEHQTERETQPHVCQLVFFQTALREAKKVLLLSRDRASDADAGRNALQLDAPLAGPRLRHCGACTACLRPYTSRPRCLFLQLAKKAETGNLGAMLSLLRERAVGVRVRVWWSADQCWYPGCLTDFDPITLRHALTYDDGDKESARLWLEQVEIASEQSAQSEGHSEEKTHGNSEEKTPGASNQAALSNFDKGTNETPKDIEERALIHYPAPNKESLPGGVTALANQGDCTGGQRPRIEIQAHDREKRGQRRRKPVDNESDDTSTVSLRKFKALARVIKKMDSELLK